MSRKITQSAVNAFYANKNFSGSNTSVTTGNGTTVLKLYSTIIAKRNIATPNVITIQTGGFNTRTTFDRLNGLKNVRITTKKGVHYLNGEVWNGQEIEVNQL